MPDLFLPADFLLSVGPSERHSFLEDRGTMTFDSSSCDNSMTHFWNFTAYQEFLAPQGIVMHSDQRKEFSSTSENNLFLASSK
jgi:hypothetical protein